MELHILLGFASMTADIFFDGLKEFRRTHGIDGSVIMRFFVADKNTSFEVDVIGPIHL